MRNDIITGALAEFAVYEYLREKGIECTEPDLTIHETRTKSFGADLKSKLGAIHVKSQTSESAQKYGLSWLFQDTDRLFELPSEHAHLAFCMVDGETVHVKAIVHNIAIAESSIISRPRVGKYAMTKKAIYWADLEKSGLDLWSIGV